MNLMATESNSRSQIWHQIVLKLDMLEGDELSTQKTHEYANALISDMGAKSWTERPCESEGASEGNSSDPVSGANMSRCYDLIFANGTALTISLQKKNEARVGKEAQRSLYRDIDMIGSN